MIFAVLSPMGRQPRRHEPDQLYLVTTRCHQARFFLRPDRQVNEAVLEWLARAQLRFPKLRILAVCVLSNHLHLVVRDEGGELAAWTSYFLGQLARAVNVIRGRRGTFFERRYSAEPILDGEALLDRLVYVVANPVKAGLCKRAQKWPGVVLFAADDKPHVIAVSWVDRDLKRQARVRAQLSRKKAPKSEELMVHGTLTIDPLPTIDGARGNGKRVSAAIEARELKIGEERRRAGRRALTARQVLAQSWHAAPRRPKHSSRPLCHAADPALRERFRKGFAEFVSVFREASALFRGGDIYAVFPQWCYPPVLPMVRTAQADSG